MNVTSGAQAETAVAEYLVNRRFTIIDRNWRTKLCEIDIIARKDNRLYFVEVKYRRNARQGSGWSYITAQKLWRMERAAKLWVAMHHWPGEYCLSAAAVEGQQFDVQFIESVVA